MAKNSLYRFNYVIYSYRVVRPAHVYFLYTKSLLYICNMIYCKAKTSTPLPYTGMVLFAVSCFGCTIPHYLFGDQLLHANNAFYGGNTNNNNAHSFLDTSINGSTGSLVSQAPNLSLTHLNLCLVTDFSLNGSSIEKGMSLY